MTDINIAENNQSVSNQVVQTNQKLEENEMRCHSNTPLDLKNDTNVLNLSVPYAHLMKSEGKPTERYFDWCTWVGDGISEESVYEIVNKVLITDKGYQIGIYESEHSFFRGGKKYTQNIKSSSNARMSVRVTDDKPQTANVNEIKDDDGRLTAVEVIDEPKKYDALLTLSGKVLGKMFARNDIESYIKLFKLLIDNGFHPSRIDVKITDYQKYLNLHDFLNEVIFKGNYKGFKKIGLFVSGGLKKTEIEINSEIKSEMEKFYLSGLTIMMGSRKSESYYRFYHEGVKHGRDSIAYERELKGNKAKMAINGLIGRYSELIENKENNNDDINKQLINYFDGLLFSGIDMIDRRYTNINNGSLKDCPRVRLWDEFLNNINDSIDEIELRKVKQDSSLRKVHLWKVNQLKRSEYVELEGLGVENYRKYHEYLIREYEERLIDEKVSKDMMVENSLRIAELRDDGISALMTDEEILKAKWWGIEFEESEIGNVYHRTQDGNDKVREMLLWVGLGAENKERITKEHSKGWYKQLWDVNKEQERMYTMVRGWLDETIDNSFTGFEFVDSLRTYAPSVYEVLLAQLHPTHRVLLESDYDVKQAFIG